ncbi:MAG: hypothetical protein J5654_01145 [Victivallales bacterium]|nr:hypothetical protein [Victivallales bacterium]
MPKAISRETRETLPFAGEASVPTPGVSPALRCREKPFGPFGRLTRDASTAAFTPVGFTCSDSSAPRIYLPGSA